MTSVCTTPRIPAEQMNDQTINNGQRKKKNPRKLDSLLLSSAVLNLHHNQNTFSIWENPRPGSACCPPSSGPSLLHLLQASFLRSLQTSAYLWHPLCCGSFRLSLSAHAAFFPQWYVEPFLAPPSLSWIQCCLQCPPHPLLTASASYQTWLGSSCFSLHQHPRWQGSAKPALWLLLLTW